MSSESDGRSANTGSLFARTMTVVMVMVGISAFTSRLAWNLQLGGFGVFVLFLLSLACSIFAAAIAKKDGLAAIIPTGLFSAIWGVMLGPCLRLVVADHGPQIVTQALLGTAGLLAVFGALGYLSNIRYQKLESILMIALLGLIVFGLGMLFFEHTPKEVNLGYSVLGVLIFIGFFLVDFARLRDLSLRGETGWGVACLVAINIYLDILNVFLHLLSIFADTDD